MTVSEKYERYLKSEQWQRIARTRLKIDEYQCQACGTRGTQGNQLQVHHMTYKHIYHEENYVFEDLVTLCYSCHKMIHSVMNRVTSADGRRGWKDNSYIPQTHVFTLSGTDIGNVITHGSP